ncbi:type III secretion system chaperone [Lawsonia intracellularis]|uniref:Uncharacterized protein n=1 Tax=Lawsonia intracellularis (strain PHE/MN1-00) TaxID=363253 RepID=Q1MPJ1_LAWIP|nr:type III secretion system chaperone [Lawsonia intracellularis]AGC50465.1 Tir chaperone family protein [Lawsonia intracellularis N343]KAA0204485.1 Tir chaperone family protein [Lawsonia intracellularis]MBZ3892913.1 type III secretion system chaperone [Lawsonia intracellularis]RBN32930.1 CesT family type III secretion system chaperone [Lawsonia intracellularis]RBN35248.1 CesT family type III secretion system chaperone [Lawsonia intracellularis]
MDAQSLIKELGPIINLPDLALDENNVCRVEFDDMPVDFEALPDGSMLYIYAQVSPVPPPGRREKLFTRLLTGNLFGGETLGSTLGYDINQESIVMHIALAVEKNSFSDFQTTLERFLDRLKFWREECQDIVLGSGNRDNAEDVNYKDGLRV